MTNASRPAGATSVANDYLFNFSSSYLGGGYKRLHAYAEWFNRNGGANFVLHPQAERLIEEFPSNRYFAPKLSRIRRVFNDWDYVSSIVEETGKPDLYYSFGIPLYRRFGRVNWFHISNILTLRSDGIPMSLFDSIRVGVLQGRVKGNLHNADVISGESLSALGVLSESERPRGFLSVNGSDDELGSPSLPANVVKDDIVAVVGTYRYKALEDSIKVFDMLKAHNPGLRLVIVGDRRFIPAKILKRTDVDATGLQPRAAVIELLRRSRYYVSTTMVEGSWNAAAEGIGFADESFISDIGPHRELLEPMRFDEVRVPGMKKPVLHVNRGDVSLEHLKHWETVIVEMLAEVNRKLR